MANAMGNAARFFKSVILPRVFRVKNAIRSRKRYVAEKDNRAKQW